MFTVAPSGSTKLDTRAGTPRFVSTQRVVIGSRSAWREQRNPRNPPTRKRRASAARSEDPGAERRWMTVSGPRVGRPRTSYHKTCALHRGFKNE